MLHFRKVLKIVSIYGRLPITCVLQTSYVKKYNYECKYLEDGNLYVIYFLNNILSDWILSKRAKIVIQSIPLKPLIETL